VDDHALSVKDNTRRNGSPFDLWDPFQTSWRARLQSISLKAAAAAGLAAVVSDSQRVSAERVRRVHPRAQRDP
jgi:hypothetical protein